MATTFKKLSRRIANAIKRNEAQRESLVNHIDRINQLAFKISTDGILDLEIKIEDSYKQLEKIPEGEPKNLALYQLKGYEAFIEYHKNLRARV